MRILHVSPSLEVAGAELILVDLARHASAAGHQVAVVAPPGPLADELVQLGIACRHFRDGGRSVLRAASTTVSVARMIRAFRPTVIHAHNPKMAAVAATARRACPGGRAPVLAAFHGGDQRDDRLAARLLRLAQRVVCVEDDLETRISTHGCRPERTQVIVNSVAPALAADHPTLLALDAEFGVESGGGGPLVAIIGTLAEHKAVDRFVRAAAIVSDAVPDARFVVVGDGPLRGRLEALGGSLGLGRRIRFLGVRRDAAAIIQRSTVVVSTSRGEGLSLVALEALSAGTPMIAPDVGGMRRLLAAGAGVVLADTEPSTVAAAVIGLLSAPDRIRSMGRHGRALVAAHHDCRDMFDAYMAVYTDLSAARS